MGKTDDLLQSIDSKLSALLTLAVVARLKEGGATRTRDRSMDQLLSDAGLSASAIGALLGKTERAVHLQLQKGRRKRPAKASKALAKGGGK
jgi:hypothetical protein